MMDRRRKRNPKTVVQEIIQDAIEMRDGELVPLEDVPSSIVDNNNQFNEIDVTHRAEIEQLLNSENPFDSDIMFIRKALIEAIFDAKDLVTSNKSTADVDPEMYEQVNSTIKNIADMSKTLIDIYGKVVDISKKNNKGDSDTKKKTAKEMIDDAKNTQKG